MELQILNGTRVVQARRIGTIPVRLGRAPDNELVLDNPHVSSRHAVVWVDSGALKVRDLDSTNGTFIGDVRVRGVDRAKPGDLIRVGHDLWLRVAPGRRESVLTVMVPLMVEDLVEGHRHALRQARFRIGAEPDAALRFGDLDSGADLKIRDNGEVWLYTDGEKPTGPILPATVFSVGGRRFRLVSDPERPASTVEIHID